MAKDPRYLQPKAGRYYAHVNVPKAVQGILGKSQYNTPLGADRTAALDQLPAAVAAIKAEIAAAKRQLQKPKTDQRPAPSPRRQLSPVEIAHQHLQDRLAFDEEIRDSGSPLIGVGDADPIYVRQLRDLASGRRFEPLPEPVRLALDFAKRNGPLENEAATLRLLARAELVALDIEMHRDEGEADPPIPAELIPPKREDHTPALNVRIIGRDSTMTLAELLPRYVAEKAAKPATAYEYEVGIRMFEEFLGQAKPAYAISRQDVIDYKNALTQTPSNYTKLFPGKTLPAAIKANKERKEPHPTLNSTTINDKWLARLRALLSWCVVNNIVPDNPTTGIRVDRIKGSSQPPRVPFAPGDLAKIFAKPLDDPEAYWALLIALFTGMRASEIAQLKLDSIRHVRNILVFEIEEQTKTYSSRRPVPVHSVLITLGLEDRIAKLRAAGETHLFPNWYGQGQKLLSGSSRSITQPYSNFLPRWFNRTYLRNVGVVESGRVFHSFRHTLKSALARAGVARSVSDEITGHDDESAGGGYVHDAAIEAMKDALERIIFDGFDANRIRRHLAHSR